MEGVMNILELNNVRKVYKTKNVETVALKDVNFSVEKNEFIAIMGESGSGKTTLLNVISTLDKQTNGKVVLNGKDISTLKESEVAKFRREKLGFVFQDFNLLDIFSNKDNIFLPMVLSDYKPKEMEQRLSEIQGLLGIESFVGKYPYEISGGQRQRIAIARALITKPDLILADEPTGALDSKSSDMILDLFTKINKLGQTILMVTHSVKAASFSNRVIFIKDGVVFHEIYKGNSDNNEFMQRINESLSVINNRGVDNEF
ncbi:ABC transporter, ATP-binding protein [Finegoldia magna ATCC 53516]|uniref:ABC transporter, ATP-binding protein n=3 Tax=Finegoldia magna TaxID=1260 RepID=D6SBI2_FINMA|nr:ABC transporter, ATP-binding protein [Finegoldia magna ATCC 53516]